MVGWRKDYVLRSKLASLSPLCPLKYEVSLLSIHLQQECPGMYGVEILFGKSRMANYFVLF